QVAAFDHDPRAQLRCRNTASVVRVISHFLVGFVARAHVGPDSAVVKQIDRSAQDRADQALAVERLIRNSQSLTRLGAQLDPLLAARPYSPTRADELRVVIRPLRPRLFIETLALLETRRRVGVGIDEDMAMVESGDELDVSRIEHPVSEHVARHVSDSDHGDGGAAVGVTPEFPQMPPCGLPCAPRGYPHLLVVEPVPASRRESIAEPEPA